jgi:tungstate transport system substrate-binding protein
VGVAHYISRGAFAERRVLTETIVPMSLGSFVGATTGGLLVGLMPVGILKVTLGVILTVSAFRTFRRSHASQGTSDHTPFSPARPEIVFATTASAQDSGLLEVLVPAFEQESGYQVKVLAVGTGQALAMAAKGESDVVLAHAPATEKHYLAHGIFAHRHLVMHNTFVLAGPASDPAKVREVTEPVDALRKIAEAQAPFVSRGDDSGTHKLEKRLWEQAGLKPEGGWYLDSGQGMGRTLRLAGERQAYILCDRATYLAFHKVTGLAILLEDASAFLNLYHVLEPNSEKFPKANEKGGKAFAGFLLSAQVQDMLKTFGVDKFGEVLFHPDAGKTEVDFLRFPG